jgi:2,3-bisphosphoglycerate-dependent phosphoglycerate mutase
VPFSASGRRQARILGISQWASWKPPSAVYSSELCRATETVSLLVDAAGWQQAEIRRAWQLNERDYGELEGWQRTDVKRVLGEDEYRAMHRGWNVSPPRGLAASDDAACARRKYPRLRYPGRSGVDSGAGESLAQVSDRVSHYWLTTMKRELAPGQDVLVVAHSNSLRCLIKLLRSVPDSALASIKVAVCKPEVLALDQAARRDSDAAGSRPG